MKKHKIIFLDIDGVLTSYKSGTLINSSDPADYHLEYECMTCLTNILDAFPDCKVVIHSSWVKHKDDPDFVLNIGNFKYKSLMFELIDILGDRCLGCVDVIPNGSKGKAIAKWIDDNIENLDNYSIVILDDDIFFRPDYELDKFIESDGKVYKNVFAYPIDNISGLTWHDFMVITSYLLGKDNGC